MFLELDYGQSLISLDSLYTEGGRREAHLPKRFVTMLSIPQSTDNVSVGTVVISRSPVVHPGDGE